MMHLKSVLKTAIVTATPAPGKANIIVVMAGDMGYSKDNIISQELFNG